MSTPPRVPRTYDRRPEGVQLAFVTNESTNGDDPGGGLSPFERFERLTQHVVSVPKSEVDERRKKLKAERKRAAARKK